MKTYIKPINFIDSPQQSDAKIARLAGSMVWFSALEVIMRDSDGVKRQNISLNDWDKFLDQCKTAQRERLVKLFENTICARTPLVMGRRNIPLDQPQIMGILNLTPDSFSDGREFTQEANSDDIAADAAFAMASDGAAIIDVGGESTRPGAKVVWEGDEIDRILPVIKRLTGGGIAVSVDTRKAALSYDKRSVEVVRKFDVPVILMHAPSQGDNPHDNAHYDDIIFDIYDWLENRVDEVEAFGVAREKILIDPGIGFGKNLSENLKLINNLSLFHAIGCPIVFGASRKRLIGALSNEDDVHNRLGGSLFLALKAIEKGVHIVRVHDVFETVQAVRVWRGLRDAALTALVYE